MEEIEKVLPKGMKDDKKCLNKECKLKLHTYKTFTQDNRLDQVCNNGRCHFKAKEQNKTTIWGYK